MLDIREIENRIFSATELQRFVEVYTSYYLHLLNEFLLTHMFGEIYR